MNTYVILLRGINVGGKNKIPMAALKSRLEEQGFTHVTTYIQSGNVILKSELDAKTVGQAVETMLSEAFTLDSPTIKALVLTPDQLQAIVDNKPEGFGEEPEKYHSDAIFLIEIDSTQAVRAFNPRENVDQIWQGEGVIYSQRLSAQLSRSRLNKIVAAPDYKSMTIRSWSTTTKLLDILKKAYAD